jgi:hypothetical protein
MREGRGGESCDGPLPWLTKLATLGPDYYIFAPKNFNSPHSRPPTPIPICHSVEAVVLPVAAAVVLVAVVVCNFPPGVEYCEVGES